MDASAFGERLLKSRRFARLPIWLFQHGFGPLAGGQDAELRLFDTEHCGAYFIDRPAYIESVAEFLRS